MAVKRNNTGQNTETMRLQDLIELCISRWKWFVLSIFCTISMAVFYIFIFRKARLRMPSINVTYGTQIRTIPIDSNNTFVSQFSFFSHFHY